ncbi:MULTISPECIES: nuclease-related domain-containing protein [unclassified Agarivorans]|uniref:nuclease-related domain-containing protein n=1 Tax=unclassified Agarivorans TaxID=2636026 RepID=UPI0026E22544|nr:MULTISPECIES: NERD domain-containing protein [unclassified Agarivorans]MDO6685262.1 NERD domain-containing protein [Agarivorans sp. 3_MG-2023]MDO6715566.1 NERD domain-containing protein [Agarivorans sp. 2_MG-2023]
MLTIHWLLILLVLCSFLLRTAWFKGWFGELLLSLSFKFFLDGKLYKLVNDVTLHCEDGTTQIDHVLISPFGVFVVETKNMKGWIFGSEHQKQWTQQIYRHRSKFQNPLHQNYKHLKALESALDLKPTDLFSVVCFVGDATFKTAMPVNVTHIRGCLRFIRSKQERVFTESEVEALVVKLEELKLKRGLRTSLKHKANVRELVAEKSRQRLSGETCPKCGAELVERLAKRGKNAGNAFIGCSAYPRCKFTQ